MKGDYHRYLAKFKGGEERKEATEAIMNSYKAAQVVLLLNFVLNSEDLPRWLYTCSYNFICKDRLRIVLKLDSWKIVFHEASLFHSGNVVEISCQVSKIGSGAAGRERMLLQLSYAAVRCCINATIRRDFCASSECWMGTRWHVMPKVVYLSQTCLWFARFPF